MCIKLLSKSLKGLFDNLKKHKFYILKKNIYQVLFIKNNLYKINL